MILIKSEPETSTTWLRFYYQYNRYFYLNNKQLKREEL